MKLWRMLGEYNAETAAWSTFAGQAGINQNSAGAFTLGINGRLKGLRIIVNRSAATSLINHVWIRLSSTDWTPNQIECGVQGSGLQTAPALQSGDTSKMDWEVDQPIKPTTQIALEGFCLTADTSVTVSVVVYGYFEV